MGEGGEQEDVVNHALEAFDKFTPLSGARAEGIPFLIGGSKRERFATFVRVGQFPSCTEIDIRKSFSSIMAERGRFE